MPLERPTLPQLIERTAQDVSLGLGVSPLLSRSLEAILARVQALAAHGLYGQLEWLSRQIFPNLAEDESLANWAEVWGLSRKPATEAFGDASFAAAAGAELAAGTLLQGPTGQRYQVVDPVTAQGGGGIVAQVRALEGGLAGNAPAGVKLSLVSPVIGVSSPATVLAPGLIGGLDQESDDALRERLLTRIRTAPKGGAADDYRTWALEVAGVTRVWVYPLWGGPGSVGVTFVLDQQPGSILPSSPKLTEVQQHLDARRPVTALVLVFAPTLLPVNLTISVTPNTAAVRAAVQASIADLFAREAAPGTVLQLQKINEAISTTPGETAHQILSPLADIAPAAGVLPTLGVITWA